jgi:hypothetical protein
MVFGDRGDRGDRGDALGCGWSRSVRRFAIWTGISTHPGVAR